MNLIILSTISLLDYDIKKVQWVKNIKCQKLRRRYFQMADKTLVCKDCGAEFVFTEGEQQFYAEKGFTNEPQRCPECRKARKAQRRNFNNENN
jgi:DNA replicative helicase MCM subunit Mcm2 (Cdc46/Mcm family)